MTQQTEKFDSAPPTGVSDLNAVLRVALTLGRALRNGVVETCEAQPSQHLGRVAADGPGDTIYEIDRASETILLAELEQSAASVGGVVLIAEGLDSAGVLFPKSLGAPEQAAWRFLVDPIDGTRGLMFQKRSAWVLIGVAPNRGAETKLSDIDVAVQIEIPTGKQHLCDELWSIRGCGAQGQQYNRLERTTQSSEIEPSQATSLAHGFAMLTRFFPGGRDVLAQIDDDVMLKVLGPPKEGKALCFEDQYASTGGQLYELSVGHDRFNADLRPLLGGVLKERGLPAALCCHPYDLACLLIAQEAGVIITAPDGSALDCPLDTTTDVAWVGYANRAIQQAVQPALLEALGKRGLI